MFCVKFTNESEPTVTEQNSDMPIFNPTVIDTDTQPANKMVKGKRNYNTNDLIRQNDHSILYAPKSQNSNPAQRPAAISLISGILSIITGMLLPFISFPLGIVGIVSSLISKRISGYDGKPMSGLAIGGLIISILGAVSSAFWGIIWILALLHP